MQQSTTISSYSRFTSSKAIQVLDEKDKECSKIYEEVKNRADDGIDAQIQRFRRLTKLSDSNRK